MIAQAAKKILSALLPMAAYYKLVRFCRARVLRSFQPRVIERVYGGFPLKVQFRDATGQGWYDCDWPLPGEMRQFFGRSIKPGARVFDLGAHQAVVALMLARQVQPGGSVIAVEGDPWNAAIARENQLLNDAENLAILLTAVADQENGEIPDSAAEMNRMYDWSQCGVPRSTIDGIASRHGQPDLVYMDIDGYEIHALRGAARVLAGNADWFVEVHVKAGLENEGGTWQEVLAFFPPDRYERLISEPGRNGAYVPFDPQSPILQSRFFMVALNRQRPGCTGS